MESDSITPYETFLIKRSGSVATVSFNRPEKLNPINEQVTRELLAIAHELQSETLPALRGHRQHAASSVAQSPSHCEIPE